MQEIFDVPREVKRAARRYVQAACSSGQAKSVLTGAVVKRLRQVDFIRATGVSKMQASNIYRGHRSISPSVAEKLL
jgi:hypothetical protein